MAVLLLMDRSYDPQCDSYVSNTPVLLFINSSLKVSLWLVDDKKTVNTYLTYISDIFTGGHVLQMTLVPSYYSLNCGCNQTVS